MSTKTIAQQVVKTFDEQEYNSLEHLEFGAKKEIPKSVEKQVLTALSFYPELKDTKIIFKLRKTKTPLSARPRIFSIFKSKKRRTYIITISTESVDYLNPILFSNLPYNAQVGVIGHELGHIVYYKDRSTFQLLGLGFKILNSKYVDEFEFNTDRSAIEYGLGYQLLDWSAYVRQALNIDKWQGATNNDTESGPEENERYMNPKTILKYISQYEIYNGI